MSSSMNSIGCPVVVAQIVALPVECFDIFTSKIIVNIRRNDQHIFEFS